ncbi:ephrin type-A receptor 4-like [Montipora foliosa]|uniref:ephrin type-A receptor 4-like n=1 Tax=Montipora foliosa TaxID=591990 RepID=UPI0035F1860A
MPLQVKSKFIVLGFRDQGGCRSLFSVKMSYKVCPLKLLGDRRVSLPQTFPQKEPVIVEGNCTTNSVQTVPGNLIVLCDSNGEWNTSQLKDRCVCKEGMENVGGICQACPPKNFNEGKGWNCTEIPSAPRNLLVTFVNQSAIELAWEPPEKTGDEKHVFYDVKCRKTCNVDDANKCVQKTCDNNVNYIPRKEGVHETHVMITHLLSYVTYEMRIYARNRVSEVAQKMHGSDGNFASISVKTNGSLPGKVEVFLESLSGTTIRVSWRLVSKNGDTLAYYLTYTRADDANDSQTLRTTKTDVILYGLEPGKTYSFVVRDWLLRTSLSYYTLFVTNRRDSRGKKQGNYTTYIIVSVVLSTVFFTVATLTGLFLYRQRKVPNKSVRRVENSSAPEESVALVEEETLRTFVILETNANGALDGGQYMEMSDIHSCFELERNEIKFVKVLGGGNFGKVQKAIVRGTTVAVKSLKDNATIKDKQDMLTELQVMKCLKPHPHVLQLIGCCSHSDPLLIALEYMPYGDLLGYLRKSRGHCDIYNSGEKKPTSRLTAMDLLSFAWMIADGMSYLADMRVVHRDLAARNILVGENRVCKISDFGLARDVNADIYVRSSKARLPAKWMPPESLFLGESSTMSDVWSYGIVLWEVFTIGDSPYPRVKSEEVASLLERGYRMPRPIHISEELYSIMSECWSENSKDRPTFSWICTALRRLMGDHKSYVNLDVYNDKDYINFDVVGELQ